MTTFISVNGAGGGGRERRGPSLCGGEKRVSERCIIILRKEGNGKSPILVRSAGWEQMSEPQCVFEIEPVV